MRLILPLLLIAFAAMPSLAQDEESKIFPYDYHVRDLDNGLRVIVVPTDFPNIVSLHVPVSVGSRNEIEPGKSGFAHFFEHMMFRGTETYSSTDYQNIIKNAGADDNAYTTDDRTVYHTTFSKDDLETMLKLHGDRFQNLEYSDAAFRTEALAVLGEYNKNSADPVSKLFEVQRATAFKTHTYAHTTMGFIEDIEDMPNQFDYSRTFFDRYYRPEYATVMLVGDVEPETTFDLVEKYWGDWERGSYTADIPAEPAPNGPLYAHMDWESETPPWVVVAFRGPASYGADDADMRALDIVSSYAFSSSSELYQKLVVEEQLVDVLWPYFPDRADPNLVSIFARVKDTADVWRVRDMIQQTLADMRANGVDPERMAAIKSNIKYGFASALDNSPAIASALAPYVAVTRDVGTVNEIYARYDTLTPDDVQAAANAYFTDQAMVVTTLSHGDLPAVESNVGTVDGLVENTERQAATESAMLFETIAQPSSSPLVDLRFLFLTGAADDPEGKEGLAELTARMVADAGSEALAYGEIQQAFFPLAAGFGAQVDKEMTVFGGRAHRDNLDRYYEIVSGQLFDPGFREEDFRRVKSNLVNAIRVELRSNNDEELGKEVLYEMIYADHPYGHLNLGHVEAIEALTLDDVRAFYNEHYTQRNLMLGIAGDASDAFVYRVQDELAAELPEGETGRQAPITRPSVPEGTHVTLVDKDTRAAAISMGFPIEVTRSHPDFLPLWLVRSYFGEHRQSIAHLFQRIREERGMNYGDYAYIEYFPRGMFLNQPDNNLGRYSQIFQIWIRPVPPEQTHFAIRAAKYELDKLVREGMSQEDFDAAKNFLLKYTNVLTQSQDRQIGYALDSQFYGTKDFNTFVREGLSELTLEDANRVIREHLDSDEMALVVVTPNAEELADRLAEDTPSPMNYNAPKPDEILEEDEVIEVYPLGIERENIQVVPVEEVFETGVFVPNS